MTKINLPSSHLNEPNEFTRLLHHVRIRLPLPDSTTPTNHLTPDAHDAWSAVLIYAAHTSIITSAARNAALDVLGRLSTAKHAEVLTLALMVKELCDRVELPA